MKLDFNEIALYLAVFVLGILVHAFIINAP